MSIKLTVPYGARRIFVSFSGGKTSAFMAEIILSMFGKTHEIIILFANTGQEDPKTLKFADGCDSKWRSEYGIGITYLEADINPERGAPTGHKIVRFATATRGPRLFEDLCSKYDLPNVEYIHCTRELKEAPMYSYVKSLGWLKSEYAVAIGIRYDEIDRVSETYKKRFLWYPLASLEITKEIVNDELLKWPFQLGLSEHQGNCVWCYKKSVKKLFALIRENEESFNVPASLESCYSHVNAPKRPRKIFRGNLTTVELIAKSKNQLDLFYPDDWMNESGSCSDGCEILHE